MSIGTLIAAERRRRGWSGDGLARRLNAAAGRSTVTRNEVSRWERGARTPKFWLPFLAQVLNLDLAELERAAYGDHEAAAEDALRVAHEWLVTDPPQIEALRAGRRVGVAQVQATEERVQELRRLDDHLGGADTMALVERELRATAALVNDGSYTETVGRRLLSALGDLHQLAGWVTSDAGRHGKAERFYLDGVRAAHAAADRVGAANLLSSLSYQVANVGRPADAVLLARTAVRGAEHARGRVRALLLERVAWAHARAGESKPAEQALDQVDEAYGDAGEDEPEWVYWLDRREIDVMAGRCYVEMQRPLRAEPLLRTAIASYPEDRARETGLYQTWLAEAYFQANELDAAATAVAKAQRLAVGVHSERLAARVRELTV